MHVLSKVKDGLTRRRGQDSISSGPGGLTTTITLGDGLDLMKERLDFGRESERSGSAVSGGNRVCIEADEYEPTWRVRDIVVTRSSARGCLISHITGMRKLVVSHPATRPHF